jgi:8-oxo-dGTP pyrophosphatase MutT (NUDIX family)
LSEAGELLRQRLDDDPGVVATDLPQAAVLIALQQLEGKAQVILTRRASHLRLHAGEIAFPGGKCDPEDHDHWSTALREAEEEVALPASLIDRLGVMHPLITRTQIEVTPCVGQLTGPVALVPNPDELDAVFKVPLTFFADKKELQFDRFDYGGHSRMVPRYQWQDYSIWGITAAMLVQLVNLAFDAGLDLEAYWERR